MKEEHKKRTEKCVSNNVVALLAIIFAIVSLACNIKLYKETEKFLPVGYSVAQGSVTLEIIGHAPVALVTYPNGCEVVSGTIILNGTITDEDGNSSVENGTFSYSNTRSESSWSFIGAQVYDGNIWYEQSWDTTAVSDGIYYKIRLNARDINELTGEDKSNQYFAVNNIDEEPDWEEFKHSVSTNLSTLSEWWNLSNLRLGNTYGLINFSGQTLNVDGINLSDHLNISLAKISMDSEALPCMNVPAYLHFFNVSINTPKILRDGVECPSAICTLVSNNGIDVVIRVTSWTTYEVVDLAQIEIWDVTDKNVYNGNQTRHRLEDTQFYANLTSNGTAVNENYISCWILFNFSTEDNQWEEMEFKVSQLYEFQRHFKAPGIYRWVVVCNSTQSEYFNYIANDTVNISNRPPILTSVLPNITMEEDRQLQYVDLDDYFEDPDGDTLSYNSSFVHNVEITINSDNVVIITPDPNWYGNRSFVIYATDPYNLTATSNTVYLTVIDMPEEISEEAEGGGGGGGGYTELEYQERPDCVDKWECSPWSACKFRWPDMDVDEINENDGIRTRTCVDVNKCNYWWKRPNETMLCFYQPTCDDHIKNQGEEKVDCGGPNCPPCPTCDDGIQNQNETDVDCGGPCPPCPSCYDGIQNQGEEGVDCGGPCRACVIIEKPGPIFDWMMIGLLILMLSVTFFTTYIFVRPYIVRITLSIMEFGERLKKKEVPKKSLLDLESETLSKLDILIKRIEKGDLEKISEQFNAVFRGFLREALNIEYEFTYEELMEEIKKQKLPRLLKIALSNYVRELIEVQYGRRKLTKELLRKQISRAKEIVDLIVKNLPKEEEVVERKVRLKESREHIRRIYKLVVEVRKAVAKNDFKMAEKAYADIKSLYKKLPEKQKKEIYSRLSKLKKVVEGIHKKEEK